jgi:hypothetical protein
MGASGFTQFEGLGIHRTSSSVCNYPIIVSRKTASGAAYPPLREIFSTVTRTDLSPQETRTASVLRW